MYKDEKNSKSEEKCSLEKKIFKHHHCHNHGGSNAIYGLGVVGALFYFLQEAKTFVPIATGIGKAVFWPALVVFKLLSYLKM